MKTAIRFFFNPGEKIGEPARILRLDPPLPSLRFQNEVTTGPEGSGDQACIYGAEFSSLQFIRGSVPAGLQRFSIKGAIPDPAASCAELFFKKLQQEGIAIEQKELPQKANRLSFSATYSPTVKEIVHHTNRSSVNLFAEHLLKQMGWVVYQEGSTAAGIRAVWDFWASQNMDLSGFNMVDGSGLSRKNLVTAKQLVEMLIRMKKSKAFPVFFESLPELENGIKAKSGSMSLIKAYAGYIEDVAFAIIVNQCLDSKLMNEAIKSALSKLHHKLTKNASL